MTRSTTLRSAALGTAMLAAAALPAHAKPLDSIGITSGSLGNPYFVSLTQGISDQAHKINPSVQITSVSAEYDLNKQFTQIDNFIAKGVNLIILNAVDPNAILPAVKRAQQAGIPVVAVDVAASGADATVMTDNIAAGRMSCTALMQTINHKGNVIIMNGPQVSSIVDRVKGCKEVIAKEPGVTLLTSSQDGKASRDGGLAVMQTYLVRYPDIAGLFAINDPEGIGAGLAAEQAHRPGIAITSVDGAPDIVSALKSHSFVQASAAQDPYTMGKLSVSVGNDILNGHPPAEKIRLMTPRLVNRDNVAGYPGWTAH